MTLFTLTCFFWSPQEIFSLTYQICPFFSYSEILCLACLIVKGALNISFYFFVVFIHDVCLFTSHCVLLFFPNSSSAMLLAVPVFLDIGYLVIIIDLKRWNANSMSEAFEPGSTAHFVYTVEIHFISFVYIVSIQFKSLFLLCGYTITTEFIFLVNFTLITVLTSIKLLLSLIVKKFNFTRGILPRHLYLL